MTDRTSDVTRRDILRNGVCATGGLAFGSIVPAERVSADAPPQVINIDLGDIGFVRYNPCSGECMKVVRGRQQVRIHVTEDDAGGFHLNFHTNLKDLHAIGLAPLGGSESPCESVGEPTGTEYVAGFSGSQQQTVRPPFPQTVTFIENDTIAVKGAGINLKTRVRNKLTVNANGAVTVDRVLLDIEDCTK